MVEEGVRGGVDEELAGGAVDDGGACHGDGADLVREAVSGFVLDRGALGRDVAEIGVEAAALDHESFDDAVEDGPRVEIVVDVGEEVRDGDGRFLLEELDGDVSEGGLDQDFRVFRHGESFGLMSVKKATCLKYSTCDRFFQSSDGFFSALSGFFRKNLK